jgi:hypothetical protein
MGFENVSLSKKSVNLHQKSFMRLTAGLTMRDFKGTGKAVGSA